MYIAERGLQYILNLGKLKGLKGPGKNVVNDGKM
jgi:hypothetical protein